MSCAHKKQDCPRRTEGAPPSGDTAPQARPARQHRGVGLDMPRMLSAGTFALAVASAAVVMLAGCASTGQQVPAAKLHGADVVGLAANVATTPVDAQWWRQFGDSQLDALVAQALAGSPNLAAALDRVRHAEAIVDATRGAEAPQVAFDASVVRQRLTEHGLFPPPYGGSVFNNTDAHVGLSWDADLFGRMKADVAAAIGSARAQRADADVAAQQLAAQVVRTYFQLARLESQREVAQRTLEQRTQMLSLILQRVKAGLDTIVEQRQGEGAIPDTRGQIESIDEQIELTRHLLAALTAQPMNALATLSPTLAQLHVSVQPPVLGADLLARRPDIAAALARVEASEQAVKSQRAQFYPDINFSAAAGLSSLEFDTFAKWGSRAWQFGPALHLPIFEGGTLRAELKGKNADRDAAIDGYNQLLLDAVREAADAATSAASIQRQQAHQAQALTAAESSYQYSRQRYSQGLGNELIVLNAETQMLAERRLDVDLRYRALDVQAQLMKALGGGWSAPATAGSTAVPLPPAAAAAASAPTAAAAQNDNLPPAQEAS
jgi:NodT family efflux transporter outer membrane factor (OMF) lipoprotein